MIRTARARLHAAAGVLIGLSVLWRAWITTRGFLTTDDFPIIAQADAAGPARATCSASTTTT
jgi:hypothetical protein